MALPNGTANSSTQEILAAQAHVWNHILGHEKTMSLKCAIQLGIPDIIHKHGKPMTISELATAIPIKKAKSDHLYHLMRALTHANFFISSGGEDEEEAYSLTLTSCLLLRDEPLTILHMALLNMDPIIIDPGHHMSEWFKNEDSTPFFTKQGKTFWEHVGGDPMLNELFNKSMAGDAGLVCSTLAKDCRHVFEGLKSMVDVGGGNGAIAKGFVDAFPELYCTVLDLPQVVAGLEGSRNLSFISGDMFQFIPHADAVFFKAIFHNWDDEHCVKLLKKCREAIGDGGKVIIVDLVVDDNKDEHELSETRHCAGLSMMTLFKGKERSEKEWAKLFLQAGFRKYKICPALGLRSLIEVFP